MAKKSVKFFVSYAHANHRAKEQFMALFSEQTAVSKRFDYQYWRDSDLTLGDHWRDEIARAQAETDFGLLLISPAFLASKFIVEQELPTYLAHGGKRCFPLMLAPVDFERHDLKGLQDKQIYRLQSADFNAPRAFTDVKGKRKAEFAHGVFAQLDDWLAANLK
ncbi:toll/interleukin-1 receptor domain-containing protein [Shewanella glacialipiscicola]|uniref:toll/interleukin-1 receptor domain-containing protein n=1 Tax=Shewanella glacialipiscicola TaxID=614069 RepID=UPI003D7A0740